MKDFPEVDCKLIGLDMEKRESGTFKLMTDWALTQTGKLDFLVLLEQVHRNGAHVQMEYKNTVCRKRYLLKLHDCTPFLFV